LRGFEVTSGNIWPDYHSPVQASQAALNAPIPGNAAVFRESAKGIRLN
jgi:hypothetical protein